MAENSPSPPPTVTVTASLVGFGGPSQPPLPTDETKVTVWATDGTAAAPGDYTAPDDLIITIPAGEISASGSFTLTLNNNAIAEPDETVQILGSSALWAVAGTAVTITDDDRASSTTVNLAVNPSRVPEGSTTKVTVTASLPDAAAVRSAATTVSLSLVNGTAEAGTDFTNVTGQSVTIPAGARTGSVSFSLTTVQNSTPEADKSFTVTGTLTSFTVNPVAVTIVNNDKLLPLDPSICDNGRVVSDIHPYLIVDCKALVTLRNHWTSELANAALPADHPLRSWNGSTYIGNWAGVWIATPVSLILRVTRLDLSTTVEARRISGTFPLLVGEGLRYLSRLDLSGNRLDEVKWFTLRRLSSLDLSGNLLTGNLSDQLGNVTSSNRFGVLKFLDISNNRLHGPMPSGRFFPSLNDFRFCGNALTGPFPSNLRSSVADRSGYTSGNVETCARRLSPTLTVSPSTVSEGDTRSLTVTAELAAGSTAPAGGLELFVHTKPGTASSDDFTPSNVLVTIPQGERRGAARLNLTVTDDAVNEGAETISIDLAEGTPRYIYYITTPATVTISPSDQTAAAEVVMSLETTDKGEADEDVSHQITLRISIPDDRSAFTEDKEVHLVAGGEAGDTATSSTDYTVSNLGDNVGKVVLPAGERSITETFTLNVKADSLAEGDETFTIKTNRVGTSSVSADSITYTIPDDDAVVALTVDTDGGTVGAQSTVAERAAVYPVTVAASLPSGVTAQRQLTIPLTVSAGTAEPSDFTAAAPGSVTIASGSSSSTVSAAFNLTAAVDSDNLEPAETVIVSGSLSGFTVDDAAITIKPYNKIASIDLSVESENQNGGRPRITLGPLRSDNDRAVSEAVSIPVSARVQVSGGRTEQWTGTISNGDSSGTASHTFDARPSGQTTPVFDDQVVNTAPRYVEVTRGAGGTAGWVLKTARVAIGDDEQARRPTGIELTADRYYVSENAGTAMIKITASFVNDGGNPAGLDVDVDVPVEIRSGKAIAGTDYRVVDADGRPVSSSFTITIPSGQISASASIYLAITEDFVVEGSILDVFSRRIAVRSDGRGRIITLDNKGRIEGLWVRAVGTPTPNGFKFRDAIEPIKIFIVDGKRIILSLSQTSLTEGATDTDITVTASLPDGAPAQEQDLVVGRVRLVDGTAVLGSDYTVVTLPAASMTIPAGQRSVTTRFRVRVVDDILVEGSETISLTGDAPPGYALTESTLTININDEAGEVAPTGVRLSLSSDQFSESGSPQTLTVTARLGDWTAAPTTHTYTNSQNTDVTIPCPHDEFGVARCSYTAYGATVQVTKEPVFTPSTKAFPDATTVTAPLLEASGTISYSGPVEFDAATVRAALLEAATRQGLVQAVSGVDFVAPPPIKVVIPAGRTSGVSSVSLEVPDDGLSEPAETIKLDGTVAGLTIFDVPVLIPAHETRPSVTLSARPESVSEADGTVSLVVTAAFDDVIGAGGQTEPADALTTDTRVVVAVGGERGDTAVKGTDFAPVQNIVLTIPAGGRSASTVFKLPLIDDGLHEGTETLTIKGSDPLVGSAPGYTPLVITNGSLTIADNDSFTDLELSLRRTEVKEGANYRIWVTVDLVGAVPTRDAAVSGSVAGADVTVCRADANAGRVNCPSQAGKALDSTVSLGDPPVTFATADYQPVSDFNVVIPAGQTRGLGYFDLRVSYDRLVEGTEKVVVSAALGDMTDTQELAIVDNDQAAAEELRLQFDPYLWQPTEGAGLRSYRVWAVPQWSQGYLTSPSTVTVSVGGGTASGADYTASFSGGDNEFVVPAGLDNSRPSDYVTLSLAVASDAFAEGSESLVISGSASGGQTVFEHTLQLQDASAVGQRLPNRIDLSLDRLEVGEGDGTVELRVTARMSCPPGQGRCLTLDEARTVNLCTRGYGAFYGNSWCFSPDEARAIDLSSGSPAAVLGDDFAFEPASITIPAGSHTGAAVLRLRVLEDRIVEGTETMNVTGEAYGYEMNTLTLLISDNEPPAVGEVDLRFSPATVGEGAGAVPLVLTAGLTAGFARDADLEVTAFIGGGSAAAGVDYELLEQREFTFTIPAGRSGASVKVGELALVDDAVSEGLETFEAVGLAEGFSVNSAVLEIFDDDPAAVTLSVDRDRVLEGRRGAGSGAAVPVAVTAALTAGADGGTVVRDRDSVVRVSIGAPDDTAARGADYTLSGLGADGYLTITIPAGEASASAAFRLLAVDDDVAGETDWTAVEQPDGTWKVDVSRTESLSVTGTAEGLEVAGAEVAIWDLSDRMPVSLDFTVSPRKVVEGGADHRARITVTASLGAPPPAAAPISVCLRRGPPDARFGIPPCVQFEENVNIIGQVPRPHVVLGRDLAVPVVLSADTDSEGAAKTGWAEAGLDYGALIQVSPEAPEGRQGAVVVIPAGQLSGSAVFDLPVKGDNLSESAVYGRSSVEWLRVGSNLEGWTAAPAVLEIIDDDPPPAVRLELDKQSAGEGAGSLSVAVTARLVRPDGSEGALPSDTVFDVVVANDASDIEEARLAATGSANRWHDFRLAADSRSVVDDEAATTPGGWVSLTASGAPSLTEGAEVDVTLGVRLAQGAPGGGVTVRVSVGAAGDSASAGDYELVSTTGADSAVSGGSFDVHIPPGAIGKSVVLRLRITDDAEFEGAETLTISGVARNCPSSGSCSVGTTQLVIARSDQPPAHRKTVTIPAGSASASAVFALTIIDDILDEGEGEDVLFRAQPRPEGLLPLPKPAPSARLRIIDDDAPPDTVILTVVDAGGSGSDRVSENAGANLALDVSLGFPAGSAARLVDTVVTLSAADGSAGGDDYSLVFIDPDGSGPLTAGQVVIPAGETAVAARLGPAVADDPSTSEVDEARPASASFSLTDDASVEGEETFVIKGSAPGFTVGSDKVTIVDSEPDAIVLKIGSTEFSTAMELAEPSGPLTLKVKAEFPASVADGDLPSSATVITLGGSDGKLRETARGTPQGGTRVDTAVSTSRPASSADYSVQSAVSDTRNTPLTLTIPEDTRSAEGTIRVSIADDYQVEGVENLQIVGTAAGQKVSPAVIHITDNDTVLPVFDLSVSPILAAEQPDRNKKGQDHTTRVTVTARTGGLARMGVDTVIEMSLESLEAGPADYRSIAEDDLRLTVPAGAASGAASFDLVVIDDNIAEGITASFDAIQLSGSAASPITGDPITVTASGMQSRIVIVDNDIVSRNITLSAVSPTEALREGTGLTPVTVEAAFPAGSPVRPVDTVIRVAPVDVGVSGQAGPGDYNFAPGATVTIPAGELSGRASFDLTLLDDRLSEPDEAITLSGEATGAYSLPAPSDPTKKFAVGRAVLTLTDNDIAPSVAMLTAVPAPAAGASGQTGRAAPAYTGIVREGDPITEFTVTATFGPGAARSAPTVIPLALGGRQARTIPLTTPGGQTITGPDGQPAVITIPGDTAQKGAGSGKDFQIVDDDGDPVAGGMNLIIPAGRTTGSASFRLQIHDDSLVEPGLEMLTVYSTAAPREGANPELAVMPAVIRIADNDRSPTEIDLTLLDSNDQPLTSLDETAGNATVKVKASFPGTVTLGTAVVVNASISDGTAEGKGVDYTAPDPNRVTLTIPAGSTESAAVAFGALAVENDNAYEGNETISIEGEVSGVTAVTWTVNPAVLTIVDDDLAVGLTVDADGVLEGAQTSVGEAGGTVEVTAALSLLGGAAAPPGGISATLSLTETTDDDKADMGTGPGDDFVLVDASGAELSSVDLTIPSGQSTASATLRLKLTDDRTVEPDETLAVSVSSAQFSIDSVTLTILDDDVDLTVDDSSVNEGETDSITVTATVGRAAPAGGHTVAVSIADSTDSSAYTAAAADYTASPAAFDVNITAGQKSGTASFDLQGADDTTTEDTETVGATGTLSGFQVDPAVVSIADQDGDIEVSVSPAKVVEQTGAPQTITVTAGFAGAAASTRSSATAVTITISDGTATIGSGNDFVTDKTGNSFTISIPAGSARRTGTFALTARADGEDEGANGETVTVSAAATVDGSARTASTTLSILDAGVELSFEDSEGAALTGLAEEGGSEQVTVKASLPTGITAPAGGAVVSVNVIGGTAALDDNSVWAAGEDFRVTYPVRLSSTLTGYSLGIPISAGQSSGTAVITVALNNDDVAEGAETILARGAEVTLGSGVILPAADSSLNIVDDDSVISLGFGSTAADEDDGNAGDAMVTASFAATSSVISNAVEVTLSFSDGTAAAAGNIDYTAPTSGNEITVTIPALSTASSAVALTNLTIADDDRAEGTETITVGGAAAGFTVNDASLSVEDNDLGVTLIVDTDSVIGGAQTALAEDETPAVKVSARFATATASDLGAPTTVSVNAAEASTVSAQGGGVDFRAAVADAEITIPARSLSGAAVDLTGLTLNDDDIAEGEETFVVGGTLSGGAAGGEVAPGTLRIVDDDAEITLSVAGTAEEADGNAGDATVTASFDASSSVLTSATEVTLSFAAGTAAGGGTDFTAPGSGSEITVSIPAGSTSSPAAALTGLTVVDDTRAEPSETVTVGGSAPAGLGPVASASLSIADDDSRVVLSVGSSTVAEGGGGGSGVSVSAGFPSTTTASDISSATVVTLSVADGTATSADYSYSPGTANTVTIPANATGSSASGSLTGLTVTDDQRVEGAEALSVGGSSSLGAATAASLTVNDNDTHIAVTASPGTVVERAGAHTMTVAARFVDDSGAAAAASDLGSATAVTVSAAAGDTDGATAASSCPPGTGEDFCTDQPGNSFSISIAAGSVSNTGTFDLTALADNTDEEAEKVKVSASAMVDGSSRTAAAEVTIVDAGVELSFADSGGNALTALLENSGSTQVTVTASLPSGTTAPAGGAVAGVRVAGGTAVLDSNGSWAAGEDFRVSYPADPAPSDGYPLGISIPGGGSSGTAVITVEVNDDDAAEGSTAETIALSGGSVTVAGGGTLPVIDATLDITDNDAAPTSIGITLQTTAGADLSSVGEGDGTTTVQVEARFGGSKSLPSDVVVPLGVGKSGDTAASGTDYQAVVSPPSVTIPAYSLAGTARFDLVIGSSYNDALVEGPESLTVVGDPSDTLTAFTVGEDSLTINDDETAPTSIVLTLLDASDAALSEATEGTSTSVKVKAAYAGGAVLAAARTVSISVGVADDPGTPAPDGDSAVSGTDYAAVTSFNITIPAGQNSHTGSFTLDTGGTYDDNIAEGDESLRVAGALAGYTINPVSLTIDDDDSAPTEATLRLVTAAAAPADITSVNEDTTTIVRVQAAWSGTNSGNTLPGPTKITLSAAGGAGAVLGAAGDFTLNLPDPFEVTIPAGSSSGTVDFTLVARDDGLAGEPNTEAVAVSGTPPAGSGITVGSDSITITDQDTAPTSIDLTVDTDPDTMGAQTTVSEGAGTARLTIGAAIPAAQDRLAAAIAVDVTVTTHYTGAGGTAVTVTGTVTIPAAARSGSAQIAVSVRNDNVAGEGAGTWTIAGVSAGRTVSGASDVSITDDDTAPTEIELVLSPSSLLENIGADAQTITVKARYRGSSVPTSSTTVTLTVGASDDTASSGDDYNSLTVADPLEVTIPAKAAESNDVTFTLVVLDDTAIEPDEVIAVTGAASGYTVHAAELAILDDDAVPQTPTAAALSVSNTTVAESSGAAAVTVRLTGGAAAPFTVRASTRNGSAVSGQDYQTLNRTLSFTGTDGEARTVRITILDDSTPEPTETFRLVLSDLSDSSVTLSSGGGVITITDNDTAPSAPSGPSGGGAPPPSQPSSSDPPDPPDPVTPPYKGRFSDDEGSVHEPNIERIAAEGIALGCAADRFCPDDPVGRAQMAAFLYRAVVGRSATAAPVLPEGVVLSDVAGDAWYRTFAVWAVSAGVMSAPGGVFDGDGVVDRAGMALMLTAAFDYLGVEDAVEGLFSDVSGLPDEAVRAVEALRRAGVTLGCASDPLRYCPDAAVSRAAMASFIVRALDAAPSYKGRFSDDEGSVHEPSIERIAAEGIALGCAADRFCPDDPVGRAQMAAFLYRAVVGRSATAAPVLPEGVVLSDVAGDAWYRTFAVWAVSAGVMSAPGGVFDGDGVVDRAGMALMLTAAFDYLGVEDAVEGLFSDVSGLPDEAVRAVEALRRAGVTLGCASDPLRYCPDAAVSRAAMASFIVRALDAAPSPPVAFLSRPTLYAG